MEEPGFASVEGRGRDRGGGEAEHVQQYERQTGSARQICNRCMFSSSLVRIQGRTAVSGRAPALL